MTKRMWSPENAGFKGGKELYQSGDPEQHEEDDCSLGEVLSSQKGKENVSFPHQLLDELVHG